MRRARVIVFFALLGVVLHLRARAGELIPAEKSVYVLDAWNSEDGLPQNSILSMTQTPDGYLWLGTFNGLARFDGVRFVVFNPVNTPALKSGRIVEVNSDARGVLWMISEEGFVTRMTNGRFEAMNGKLGFGAGEMYGAGLDPSGNFWIGAFGKYHWWDGEKLVPGNVWDMKPADLGIIFASSQAGWVRDGSTYARVQNEDLKTALQSRFGQLGPKLIVPARDGDVWIITIHGAGKLRAGTFQRFPNNLTINELTQATEDAEGNLIFVAWVDGAFVYKKNGDLERLPLKDRPSANNIRTVFTDRENNIWIGTDVAGLQRLRRKAFQTYTSKDGFRGDVIRSVAVAPDHRIWTAVHGGLDVFGGDAPVRHLEPSEPLWWSVATDRNGDVWGATMPGRIARFDGETVLFTNTVPEARTLAPRAEGGMWVGSEFGLFQINTNREVSKIPIHGSDAKRSVKPIIETKDALWIGVSGEGIWKRSRAGAWEQIAAPQGLTDLRVHSLYEDGEGLIWAGTTFGGLHCISEGRARSFQNADATLPSQITSIIEDGLGFLWLGSGNGIYRVKRADLLHFLAGDSSGFTVQRFDRSDGLGTPEMSENRQPTVAKAADGKLWFASINGLSVVDPSQVRGNPHPPRVIIEDVAINGAKADHSAGAIKLPPLSDRLDIRYTGISLRSGERVRFKRRLVGLDKNWVDAGLERSASYYNLPPRDYRFEVMAANEDGVWSIMPANFKIQALPAYWQTLWFRTGLTALSVGLAAFAVLWRLRSAERAHAAQEAFSQQLIESQEQERRRIAAELHDGLGQTLLILKQQARIAEKTPNVPPAAAEQLQKVTGNAQFAIEEVRSIVSALRPALLDRIGLTAALNSMLQQLSDSGAVKLTWNLDKMDRALPEGKEIELYRIVQEALNNVVKHSNAATARVELRRQPARWTLEIEDDGCGFDPAAAAKVIHSGGLGLNGLRERARILGATLAIESAHGEGTRVRVEGPAKSAA